jgi:cobyrinic acid a,c-diamide synthase
MALRRRGLSVSVCVTGADLQQAVIYSRLSRRYVRCIDPALLSTQAMLDAIGQAGIGADIVLIDGHGGLYDGRVSGDLSACDAHGAMQTSTPGILVLDAPQVSQTLAAVVSGLTEFSAAPDIGALVLNGFDVAGISAFDARNQCDDLMGRFGLPPCIGCIPVQQWNEHLPVSGVSERENHTTLSLSYLSSIEQLVESHVAIDKVLSLASLAPPILHNEVQAVVPRGQCRIAVANDNCFGLCFQDNLDLLRFCGADLVTFSPLADSALPNGVGGVYLPGGCLDEYAQSLASNQSMFRSLVTFAEQGGVLFSEGAGTAILCRTFEVPGGGGVYNGAGLLPLDASGNAQRFANCSATTLEDSALGPAGVSAAAFATSEWALKGARPEGREAGSLVPILRFDGANTAPQYEGFSVSAQTCSTFNFLHFGSNPDIARAFVLAAAAHQATLKKK